MNLNLKIHNRNHLIKSVLGTIEFMLTKNRLKKNELTVVNYHGTQRKFLANFKKQIEFYKKYYCIISPEQLLDFYNNQLINYSKPLLLITFDDGIKNNIYAVELLKEYNIKALFFVVPGFIDTVADQQRNYFTTHIRPQINSFLDNEEEDFMAMSWEELKRINKEGHVIGSHTQTHTLVAKESTKENSVIEITNSKSIIAKKLNLPLSTVTSFCSINNTLESISEKELYLIVENFYFHFTTIPGANQTFSSPYFIKRSNIETFWLFGALKYALSRSEQRRWKTADLSYQKILSAVK